MERSRTSTRLRSLPDDAQDGRAVTSSGVMRSLLVDVSPHDPLTLGVSALLLLVVGLFAGLVPAWRASRIDPATAIRAE